MKSKLKYIMEEEKKHYIILSIILLIISTLFFLKFLAVLIIWDYNIEEFLDIFGFIWPIIGYSTVYEFLRKDRDKWGWGGILFNIVMLYSMIYCLFLVIQGIAQLSITTDFFLNLSISVVAWIGYLLYYD